MRMTLAVLCCFLFPKVARAGEGSCEEEAAALDAAEKAHGRDPSRATPTNAVAAEHVRTGNRHFRVGHYDEAIKEYTAGALIDDAPVFLYNLGQTYRLDHQYDKAIRQYRLFLDRGGPGAELRALVECHIAMMSAELAQSAAQEPPTGPAPEGGDRVEREDQPLTPAPAWYADGVGWAITGAGVIGAGVGGYLVLDAANLEDEADHEDRQDVRTELRDKADSRRIWGAVIGGVGITAVVVGVVKLAITPDDSPAREEGVALVVGESYVGLAGRF